VQTQPSGENCTFVNGSGTGTAGPNLTVTVACAVGGPSYYTIGGTVSGLSPGSSVVLQDNGANPATVSANGPFTFSTTLANQSPYAVTVATQPTGQNCSVTNGSGTVAAANITNVAVVCTRADVELWTWESGSNTTASGDIGVYGTRGTAAAGNAPGGRQGAFSWTDQTGNLWLFGGFGYDSAAKIGPLNDLWRYSPTTGLWTWMSGADTVEAQSVYGSKGVAAAGNVPGARATGASWIDGAGNLWLFGGGGVDSTGNNDLGLSDLWRYSPSTGLWTWVSGPSTGNMVGVYGTQGTAAPGNVPGGREATVSFQDAAGNLWLFGGAGFDSVGGSSTNLNDLWRYSPSTGMWTWMSGSNHGNATGVYGTQGTASAANVPGARQVAVSWTDPGGVFWLFGGEDHSGAVFNDLWRYSPTTGLWAWMSGSDMAGASGVYGTQGVGVPGNTPGARVSALSWADSAGNLWLFGGYFTYAQDFNDLWKYSVTTGLWTWIGGSTQPDQAAVYGTLGVAARANNPGARDSSTTWVDGSGNFWLLGGYVPDASNNIPLNDLWQYVPAVP
jgi:hypothetical protein